MVAALLRGGVSREVSGVASDIPKRTNRLFWRAQFLSIEQTDCQVELVAYALPSERMKENASSSLV
jgi:hypothetical protein